MNETHWLTDGHSLPSTCPFYAFCSHNMIKSAHETTQACPLLMQYEISLQEIFLFVLLGHWELIHYPNLCLDLPRLALMTNAVETIQHALRTIGPVNLMSLLTFAGGGIASITYEPLKMVPSRALTVTPSSMYWICTTGFFRWTRSEKLRQNNLV